MGWATFWAIFLQIHLATLMGIIVDGYVTIDRNLTRSAFLNLSQMLFSIRLLHVIVNSVSQLD
jgi:hypothetical protein